MCKAEDAEQTVHDLKAGLVYVDSCLYFEIHSLPNRFQTVMLLLAMLTSK